MSLVIATEPNSYLQPWQDIKLAHLLSAARYRSVSSVLAKLSPKSFFAPAYNYNVNPRIFKHSVEIC